MFLLLLLDVQQRRGAVRGRGGQPRVVVARVQVRGRARARRQLLAERALRALEPLHGVLQPKDTMTITTEYSNLPRRSAGVK